MKKVFHRAQFVLLHLQGRQPLRIKKCELCSKAVSGKSRGQYLESKGKDLKKVEWCFKQANFTAAMNDSYVSWSLGFGERDMRGCFRRHVGQQGVKGCFHVMHFATSITALDIWGVFWCWTFFCHCSFWQFSKCHFCCCSISCKRQQGQNEHQTCNFEVRQNQASQSCRGCAGDGHC